MAHDAVSTRVATHRRRRRQNVVGVDVDIDGLLLEEDDRLKDFDQRFDARLARLQRLVGQKPQWSRVQTPPRLLGAGEHVEDVVVLALEVLVQVSVQN